MTDRNRKGAVADPITVELVGLEFQFIALGGLLGFGPIQIPPMRTTVTGEDLFASWPPPS